MLLYASSRLRLAQRQTLYFPNKLAHHYIKSGTTYNKYMNTELLARTKNAHQIWVKEEEEETAENTKYNMRGMLSFKLCYYEITLELLNYFSS
jgi:hypothetical protein